MARYAVYFSEGGFVVVRAATPEEALDICQPMAEEGEALTAIPVNPWDTVPTREEPPEELPALLKRQAE